MPPFLAPTPVLSGFKERPEALLVQGDRLYIGTAVGNLHVYSIEGNGEGTSEKVTLKEVKQNLSRRSIDQLGFIKDVNSLVVLAEKSVTLYPIPGFSPPTPLPKSKDAICFTTHTFIESGAVQPSGDGDFTKIKAVPSVVTYLVIGCRRRVVIYSWRDGEPQDPKEIALDHSPRAMAFVNNEVVCLVYPPPDYAVLHIPSLKPIEIVLPPPPAAAAVASIGGRSMGAITGLFGGKEALPPVVQIKDGEALIRRDNYGIFIGADGKPSREEQIEWPGTPEEYVFVRPYVFSVLPPGTVPAPASNEATPSILPIATIPAPVVQIRSSLSTSVSQTRPFPFASEEAPTTPNTHAVRLVTPSPAAKSPVFLITAPTEKNAFAAEGSTVWSFRMKSWGQQIDEMVAAGAYEDALALLDILDAALLSDKAERQRLICGLRAVSKMRNGEYATAMDEFIKLDINPAKVVALYPENVAGRLALPEHEWIPLFGGPKPQKPDPVSSTPVPRAKESKDEENVSASAPERAASPQGSIRKTLLTGLDSIIPSVLKDDDTASAKTAPASRPPRDVPKQAVKALILFLTDRRPKLGASLDALHVTSMQSHQFPELSETRIDDLFALPDAAPSALTPDQLVRAAQVVDTALFKSYLVVSPAMLGPLCRAANWCEVAQVEEELTARRKTTELVSLYNGKKMHSKALDFLQRLSKDETDMLDKLQPSISYLQRLGPEYLEQIFKHSRWVFEQDRDMGFQIFTSEEVELPRDQVADFLESIDLSVCARYLEYLIDERGEDSGYFHNRLGELYLRMTVAASPKTEAEKRQVVYAKLLEFIDSTHRYDIERLYGQLPRDDLFEARALLLGRMSKHTGALEQYVYRLHDYLKAEQYCKRVYQAGSTTDGIYLELLKLYLQPTIKTSEDLLRPALDLISRHSPRIDPVATLDMLPPLITAQDVKVFLMEALRAPIFNTRVVRETAKARDEQISRKLMALETRRVRVTDSRICPQCHKRLGGGAVIAVHFPRGEVTHYNCREAFSARLKEGRE